MAEASIMRIKITVLLPGMQDQHKMLAANSQTSWGVFKEAAASKLGLPSGINLKCFWEGCEVDEPDSKELALFTKDGDTLVLIPDWLPGGKQNCAERSGLGLPEPAVAQNGLPGTEQAHVLERHGAGERVHSKKAVRSPPEDSSFHPTSANNDSRRHAEPKSHGERPGSGSAEAHQASQEDPAINSMDRRCTCRYSKCIKLYCVCWAAGVLCKNCTCRNCLNIPHNEDFIRSEQLKTISRNPLAFSVKVEQTGAGELTHKLGCRCRKSRCIKKYCECYDGGVVCTSQCRCSNCENAGADADSDMGGGLDSLASLASAAHLASGCLDDLEMPTSGQRLPLGYAANGMSSDSSGGGRRSGGRRTSLPPASRSGKTPPGSVLSAGAAAATALWPASHPRQASDSGSGSDRNAEVAQTVTVPTRPAANTTKNSSANQNKQLPGVGMNGHDWRHSAAFLHPAREAAKTIFHLLQPGEPVVLQPTGSKGPSRATIARLAMASASLPPRSSSLAKAATAVKAAPAQPLNNGASADAAVAPDCNVGGDRVVSPSAHADLSGAAVPLLNTGTSTDASRLQQLHQHNLDSMLRLQEQAVLRAAAERITPVGIKTESFCQS